MQLRGRLVLAGGACLIAFLLAACGGGGSSPPPSFSPPPPAPDFSLSVSPGSISVEQGATSGAATVAVNPINDFTGSVSIAVEGLPAGVTSSPASPFSVGAGQSQQVSFSVPASVGASDYTITFGGTSGTLSHSATLTLTVMPMPLPTCTLMGNPTAITQGESAQLSWSTSGAATASIDQGIGNVALPSGSVTVSPTATTIYTMTVQNAAGASSTCQATVKVFTDFELILPTAVSLSANGSTTQTGLVNRTTPGSGTEPFEVTISFASLPQAVTVTPTSQTVAAGNSFTFTLSASKDAPAVTAFPVTVTATRVSDGVVRTAEFLLTVTRITLGGGRTTYLTYEGFSPAAVACIKAYEQVADAQTGSLETVFFGSPAGDTAVTLQSAGGAGYNESTDTLFMPGEPRTTPDCASADPQWFGLYVYEDRHPDKDKWTDLFPRFSPGVPPYPAYEHVGLIRAAGILLGTYLQTSNLWNVFPQFATAPQNYFLVSRMDQNLFCIRDEGTAGSNVASSNWFVAATGLKLIMAFQQASGVASDLRTNTFLQKLNDAEYAWVNQEQRLPTMAERLAIFGQVATRTIAGQDASAWRASQPITCTSGPDGTFWDIVARSQPNPLWIHIPAIVQVGGTPDAGAGKLTRSAVTEGTVLVRLIDASGVEVWNGTFDFANGQEFAFPKLDNSGNPFPDGAYLLRAEWNGEVRQNYVAIVEMSQLRSGGSYRGAVVIFTDANGDVTDNYTLTTSDIVEATFPGCAIVRPSFTDQLPMEVTVNGKTIPVPPLTWWTVVDTVPAIP